MNRNWDIRKEVARKAREFRLAMGIAPKDFADDIGKDLHWLIDFEDGKVDIDLLTLERVAGVFDLSVGELFDAVYQEAAPLILLEAEASDGCG